MKMEDLLTQSFLMGDDFDFTENPEMLSPMMPFQGIPFQMPQPQQQGPELIGPGMEQMPVGQMPSAQVNLTAQGGFPGTIDTLAGAFAEQQGDLAGAQLAYANTQNTRFKGLGGAIERVVDAVKEPKKREELIEAQKKAAATQKQIELQEQDGRYKRILSAAQELGMQPEQADAIARRGAQDEKVAQKFFEQIGDRATADQITESTKSRNQRMEWANTEAGREMLEDMSPAERRNWLLTGQQLQKGNVTNIDTGSIPQDYRAVRDDNGRVSHYEVIPGSETDNKMKGERQKLKQNWIDMTQNASNMVSDARYALGMVDGTTTGFIGEYMQKLAGTDAADLQAELDTLRANIGFDRLQQMREASTTGGALGNVSNREIELLYNSMAALGGEGKPMPSKAVIERSLNRIVAAYERIEAYGALPEDERAAVDNMSQKDYWDYWEGKGLGRNRVAQGQPSTKAKDDEKDYDAFQAAREAAMGGGGKL